MKNKQSKWLHGWCQARANSMQRCTTTRKTKNSFCKSKVIWKNMILSKINTFIDVQSIADQTLSRVYSKDVCLCVSVADWHHQKVALWKWKNHHEKTISVPMATFYIEPSKPTSFAPIYPIYDQPPHLISSPSCASSLAATQRFYSSINSFRQGIFISF